MLEFHHRDPATKLFTLAHYNRFSLRQIVAEIAKCDVLCSSCHDAVHYPPAAMPDVCCVPF